MYTRNIPAFNNHERFFKHIQATENCWIWKSFVNDGYGKFNIKDIDGTWKQYFAHRVSWSIFNGDIPDKMILDHICRNRSCVNPDHLRVVNEKINVTENSKSFIAENILKIHCPSGHEYSISNTRISSKNGRYCLTCKREKKRLYDLRKKSCK